ncbi:hypothetical protein AAGX47_13895, partial [Staphylococcus aureus]
FIKDKTRKFKSDIFNTQNWKYDELNDEFICPNNKRIATQRISKRNSTGNASWGGTTIKKYFFYRN